MAGYIQSPLWDGHTPYSTGINSWAVLHVPRDFVVTLNFTDMSWQDCMPNTTLSIYQGGQNTRQLVKIHKCSSRMPALAMYNKTLHLNFITGIGNRLDDKGFRLNYALHMQARVLRKIDGRVGLLQDEFGEADFYELENLWNCSVSFWEDFASYFPCNGRWNCVNGEDEALCPHTNHSLCDLGQVSFGGSCYKYVHKHFERWKDAALGCTERGGALASLNTAGEWKIVEHYLHWQHVDKVLIGMKSFPAYTNLM